MVLASANCIASEFNAFSAFAVHAFFKFFSSSRSVLDLRPSKMASTLVDWSQRTLWLTIASIAFNPTAWNIVAQNGTSVKY